MFWLVNLGPTDRKGFRAPSSSGLLNALGSEMDGQGSSSLSSSDQECTLHSKAITQLLMKTIMWILMQVQRGGSGVI